jgi:hypothetical protein
LNDHQRQVLKKASEGTDAAQRPQDQYMHAMRMKGESEEVARQKSIKWLWDCLDEAVSNGRTDDGLFALGKGLHTIMDSAAPAHQGFAVWGGFSGWGNLKSSVCHLAQDFFSSIPGGELDNLTGESRGAMSSYYSMYDLLADDP